MARSLRGPEPQMGDLRKRRAKLKEERGQLGEDLRRAEAGLAAAPNRQLAALRARDLGRSGESLEEIARDVDRWHAEVADRRPRLQAKSEADATLGREQLALVDQNIPFYSERANAASEEAVAVQEEAMRALERAQESRGQAEQAWLVVHQATIRRGENPPAHVPSPDIGGVIWALAKAAEHEPWPGGVVPGSEEAEAA